MNFCTIRVNYLEGGKVNEDHVVSVSDIKEELLPTVLMFTTSYFDNNTPRIVHDFGAIERTIASRLCAFKPRISMKVSALFLFNVSKPLSRSGVIVLFVQVMPLLTQSRSTRSTIENAKANLQDKVC